MRDRESKVCNEKAKLGLQRGVKMNKKYLDLYKLLTVPGD